MKTLTSSPLAPHVGQSSPLSHPGTIGRSYSVDLPWLNQIQDEIQHEEMASGKRKRAEKEEEEELWRWCPLERDQQQGGNNSQLQSVYFRLLTLKMWEGKTRSERSMRNRWIPNHFDWYSIDSNTGCSSTTSPLTVISKMLRVPLSSASVAMGSKIYVVGGYSPCTFGFFDTPKYFLDTVFYYDTNNCKKGWKKGPSMVVKRRDPYAVPVDGKLYVFGGNEPLYEEDYRLSVEVFDPRLNKWELLSSYSSPSLNLRRCRLAPLHALLLDSCGRKHLLLNVIERRALYTYSLDAKTWKLFDPAFGLYNRQRLAVLDGFIYCFKPSTDFKQGFKVFAYDIIGRKWFRKHVEGLGKDNIPHFYPPAHLFHVGNGKLCLVTSLHMQFKNVTVEVCCTVFTVRPQRSADGDEPTLHAHVESTTCYRARGHQFIDCLAL